MKKTLMATVAAAALIASAGLASAQRQEPAPNPAPSAQQQAPAEKTAPKGTVAPDSKTQMKPSRPETTGQATPNAQPKAGDDQPKASPNAQPKTGQDQPKGSPNAQPKMGQDQPKGSPNAQPKMGQDQPKGNQPNNPTAQQPNSKQAPTTGQATRPAGDSVTLSAEQKTKLRTTVVAKAPKVTNVNFTISVGTVVPRTVHVVAVPPTLVEIHPAWRGFMYFVVHEQIIMVEPRTLKIVAVLDV